MSTPLRGVAPKAASVTSGTVSATTAITAGHIILNGQTFPAVGVAGSAAARVDDLIALINSYFNLTGVWAEKVTATTYKLQASVAITATLGATATIATCGFVTSISASASAPALLAAGNRKAFGSGLVSGDDAIIKYGAQEINVGHAKRLGLLDARAGVDVELTPASTPTRTG